MILVLLIGNHVERRTDDNRFWSLVFGGFSRDPSPGLQSQVKGHAAVSAGGVLVPD